MGEEKTSEFNINKEEKVIIWKIFEAIRGYFLESSSKSNISFDVIRDKKLREKTIIEIVIPGSLCAKRIRQILEYARDGVEDEAQRHY